jgi:hypothetical protein
MESRTGERGTTSERGLVTGSCAPAVPGFSAITATSDAAISEDGSTDRIGIL